MIIKFWYRNNGKSLVEHFLRKLDDYEMRKVVDLIDAYDNPHWSLGRMINAGDLKSLGGGLYDLKIRTCGSFFRFPSAVKDRKTIFLLDGFKKKKNKIEKSDINRAKKTYEEYKLG